MTLHLWRGAYEVDDIHILKNGGKIPVPFFFTRGLDLSLEWSELFHGALVSKISMREPSLNFVSGPTKDKSQNGNENDWGQTLKSLVPFDIHQLATRIPITGTFGKTDVHVWATVATLQRNAFVKSLVPQLDEPKKIEQVGTTQ